MQTIQQDADREPVPLSQAITEMLAAQPDPLPVALTWWRLGYAACERAHADDYEAGYHDGAMALKRAQHDVHRLAVADSQRWGPGGREQFAAARPGDRLCSHCRTGDGPRCKCGYSGRDGAA